MNELVKALSARTKAEFDDVWPSAQPQLEAIFEPAVWGIRPSAIEYSEANYANIWRNELRGTVRRVLEQNGVGQQEFAEWLGEIHYVSIAVYLHALFDPYQDNRGWRVLLVSVPAVGAGAVGLASHYQNAQNHDHLARASALLYDHLSGYAKSEDLSVPGRKVEKRDWTEDGLLAAPISEVAGITLPSGDTGGRVFLRDVRTTTVKKILASMISVQPIDLAQADGSALAGALADLQAIGRAVA